MHLFRDQDSRMRNRIRLLHNRMEMSIFNKTRTVSEAVAELKVLTQKENISWDDVVRLGLATFQVGTVVSPITPDTPTRTRLNALRNASLSPKLFTARRKLTFSDTDETRQQEKKKEEDANSQWQTNYPFKLFNRMDSTNPVRNVSSTTPSTITPSEHGDAMSAKKRFRKQYVVPQHSTFRPGDGFDMDEDEAEQGDAANKDESNRQYGWGSLKRKLAAVDQEREAEGTDMIRFRKEVMMETMKNRKVVDLTPHPRSMFPKTVFTLGEGYSTFIMEYFPMKKAGKDCGPNGIISESFPILCLERKMMDKDNKTEKAFNMSLPLKLLPGLIKAFSFLDQELEHLRRGEPVTLNPRADVATEQN